MPMPTDVLQSHCTDLSQYTFKRYEHFPPRASGLWSIRQGAVRSYTWSNAGAIVTLGYWGPGDVVGPLLSQATPYKIECLTAVEAVRLAESDWQGWAEAILVHARQIQELLQIVRSQSAYWSLQRLLGWLAGKFGQPVSSGRLIDLPLTHSQIAESIGTARVTTTRQLNRLEAEGAIGRQRQHRIVVCEVPRC